jgi:hypothetical protein
MLIASHLVSRIIHTFHPLHVHSYPALDCVTTFFDLTLFGARGTIFLCNCLRPHLRAVLGYCSVFA